MQFRFNDIQSNQFGLKFLKTLVDSYQTGLGLMQITEFVDDEDEIEKKPSKTINKKKYARDSLFDRKTDQIVYKIGFRNATIQLHEYIVAYDLAITCNHMPYFMRPVCFIKNGIIDSNLRKHKEIKKSPLLLHTLPEDENTIYSDIAMFEYIDHEMPLDKYISNSRLSTDTMVVNMYIHIFLILICAQQNCQFVHNDLHSYNVLLTACDKNLIAKFKLVLNGTVREIFIPTNGYIPTIIDYGYSYSKKCLNKPIVIDNFSKDHMGSIGYKFDSIADFTFILCDFATIERNDGNIGILKKFIINNLFYNLPINVSEQSETVKENSSVHNVIKEINQPILFEKNYNKFYQITELLTRLIKLPVTDTRQIVSYEDFQNSIEYFWKIIKTVKRNCKQHYKLIYWFRETVDFINLKTTTINVIKFMTKISNEKLGFDLNLNQNQLVLFLKSIDKIISFVEHEIFDEITDLDRRRKEQIYSKLGSGEKIVEQIIFFMKNYINEPNSTYLKTKKIYTVDNISKKFYY